jgi:hypothetical protein
VDGTESSDELWSQYLTLSNQAAALHVDAYADEMSYRREYWRLWRTYDEALSAVARGKNCEAGAVEHLDKVLENRAVLAATYERLACVRDVLVGRGELAPLERRTAGPAPAEGLSDLVV